jgi:hypothetical protein
MLERFERGVIEGFYGREWSWSTRAGYAAFLRESGFGFYLYAPKYDAVLRKRWRESWSAQSWQAIQNLRAAYREAGVQFGIGFTPFGTQSAYDGEARRVLTEKIRRFDALDLDIFCLLFDDVPGVPPDLAKRQVDITHDALAATRARAFIMCPTYYADDPILDKTTGPRPARYLETLGEALDPRVHVFWTGPRVCSPEYSEEHLADVTARLGRKPFLWDNYPVNDGPRMAKHLHLRAVTGRPSRCSRTGGSTRSTLRRGSAWWRSTGASRAPPPPRWWRGSKASSSRRPSCWPSSPAPASDAQQPRARTARNGA